MRSDSEKREKNKKEPHAHRKNDIDRNIWGFLFANSREISETYK